MTREEKNKFKKKYKQIQYSGLILLLYATILATSIMIFGPYSGVRLLGIILVISFVVWLFYIEKTNKNFNSIGEYKYKILVKKYNKYNDMFLEAMKNGEIKKAIHIHNCFPEDMRGIYKGMLLQHFSTKPERKENYQEYLKKYIYLHGRS